MELDDGKSMWLRVDEAVAVAAWLFECEAEWLGTCELVCDPDELAVCNAEMVCELLLPGEADWPPEIGAGEPLCVAEADCTTH